MNDLEYANYGLEVIEFQRDELEKRVPGGAALAYWNGQKIQIVASRDPEKLVQHQETALTSAERATSILVPIHSPKTVCVY